MILLAKIGRAPPRSTWVSKVTFTLSKTLFPIVYAIGFAMIMPHRKKRIFFLTKQVIFKCDALSGSSESLLGLVVFS